MTFQGSSSSLRKRRHPLAGALDVVRQFARPALELRLRMMVTDPTMASVDRDRIAASVLSYGLELEDAVPGAAAHEELALPATPEEVKAVEEEADRLREVRSSDHQEARDRFREQRAAAMAAISHLPASAKEEEEG